MRSLQIHPALWCIMTLLERTIDPAFRAPRAEEHPCQHPEGTGAGQTDRSYTNNCTDSALSEPPTLDGYAATNAQTRPRDGAGRNGAAGGPVLAHRADRATRDDDTQSGTLNTSKD